MHNFILLYVQQGYTKHENHAYDSLGNNDMVEKYSINPLPDLDSDEELAK